MDRSAGPSREPPHNPQQPTYTHSTAGGRSRPFADSSGRQLSAIKRQRGGAKKAVASSSFTIVGARLPLPPSWLRLGVAPAGKHAAGMAPLVPRSNRWAALCRFPAGSIGREEEAVGRRPCTRAFNSSESQLPHSPTHTHRRPTKAATGGAQAGGGKQVRWTRTVAWGAMPRVLID